MIGSIYKIQNIVNGKCYIGQTWRPIMDRFHEHKIDKVGKCLKLWRALNKYGRDSFTIDLCIIANTQSVLNHWECFFIERCNSINNGYNIRFGGSNGKLSKSSRKKISKALIGNTNSKGRILSIEHKNRIAQANTGKIQSKEQRQKSSGSHRIFTDQQECKMCDLYKNNWTCAKIGKLFKCSDSCIKLIIKRNNIPTKRQTIKDQYNNICDKYREFGSVRKIVRFFNCSEPTIVKILAKNNIIVSKNKFSKREEELICEQYLYIKSSYKIAESFNCSSSTVRNILKKRGISLKRRVCENKNQ